MRTDTPRLVLAWALVNVGIALACLLVTAILLVTLLYTDVEVTGQGFLDGVLDFTVLGALGYVPYLTWVYLMPQRWSARTRRIVAIASSPLIALFMFLPHFFLFALVVGATIVLPERR